jgi:hypothetical protein
MVLVVFFFFDGNGGGGVQGGKGVVREKRFGKSENMGDGV